MRLQERDLLPLRDENSFLLSGALGQWDVNASLDGVPCWFVFMILKILGESQNP